MAKLTCLLALFVVVVVCVEAVRIDTAEKSEGRPIPGFKKNDPRCKKDKNEMVAISKDCKKYIKCVKGDSREMTCKGDTKFDDRRHCISPKQKQKPKCTVRKATLQGPTDADPWCPRPGGTYTLPDCRKYYKCDNYKPTVITCDKGMFYSKVNGMCIKADKCPNPKTQNNGEIKCSYLDALYPNPKDCGSYIECKDGEKTVWPCPHGQHVDEVTLLCKEPCKAYCNKTLSCECNWSTCGIKDDVCFLPMVMGGCWSPASRYFFNKRSGKCERFIYSGCGQNGNNFNTMEECLQKCKKSGAESESSVCKEANEPLPDVENCRRYIECVNFKAQRKECPPGTAFELRKRTCTKEQMNKCRNNDILNIVRGD